MVDLGPRLFFRTFLDVATYHNAEIEGVCGSGSRYTDFFSGSLMPEIANKTGLYLHSECFPGKIDFVFSRDSSSPYRFDVAVEHERAGERSEEEFLKLSYLNCPLKTLVSYVNSEEQEEWLNRYRRIIHSLDLFSDFNDKRQCLVIFGRHDSWNPANETNKVGWNAYLWSNEEWLQIG